MKLKKGFFRALLMKFSLAKLIFAPIRFFLVVASGCPTPGMLVAFRAFDITFFSNGRVLCCFSVIEQAQQLLFSFTLEKMFVPAKLGCEAACLRLWPYLCHTFVCVCDMDSAPSNQTNCIFLCTRGFHVCSI